MVKFYQCPKSEGQTNTNLYSLLSCLLLLVETRCDAVCINRLWVSLPAGVSPYSSSSSFSSSTSLAPPPLLKADEIISIRQTPEALHTEKSTWIHWITRPDERLWICLCSIDSSSYLHSSSSASVGRYPGTGLTGPDEGLWSLGLGFGLSPPVRVYSRYRSDLRNNGYVFSSIMHWISIWAWNKQWIGSKLGDDISFISNNLCLLVNFIN